jgi:hypothetical protein
MTERLLRCMKVTLESRNSALQVIVKPCAIEPNIIWLCIEADPKRAYRPDGTDEILDGAIARLPRKW